MKRILLFASLFFLSFPTLASVVLVNVTIGSTRPRPKSRSVVVTPVIYADTDTRELTISFAADDSYTLYVYDGAGGVVYQGSVVADGSRQVYLLPELDADLYSISIESNSTSYEGEFHVN